MPQTFPSTVEDFITWGNEILRQKNWDEAVKCWALMREKFPEHPQGYADGAKALKENKDFNAANALILEGMKKFPKETGLYAEYGNIAMRQKDWPEAAKRWALMREKFPDLSNGYFSGAEALKENKEFEAADALVLEGLEKFPKELELYRQYGSIATRREDWPEAVQRWALMREKYPQKPHGYLGGAHALKEQGDFEAADALVLAGLKKFPKAVGLYIEYGDIAMRQKNWSEANKRWALMREKCPEHPRGYVLGEVALKELGEVEAADALILKWQENLSKETSSSINIQQERIAARRKYRTWNLIRDAKIYRNFGIETYFFFAPLADEINNPSEWESLLIQKHNTQGIIRSDVDKYYEISGINSSFSSKEEFLEHIKNPLKSTMCKSYKKMYT